MYKDYFGLSTLPFENTPDPAFFFMGARYRELLALMLHRVLSHKGLVCITGPIGCGKTTLAMTLTRHLPDGTIIIPVPQPKTRSLELMSFLAKSLGLKEEPGSYLKLTESIRNELITLNDEGRHCVLIIDEAQFMSDELFQEILVLTNLETIRHKLVQIILLGQNELLEKLSRPEMKQLMQRISAIKRLEPMDRNQSAQYIRHRIKVAGGFHEIFAKESIDLIVSFSVGIPRVINKLCDAALLRAFIEQKDSVEATDVQKAKTDLGIDLFPEHQNTIQKDPVQKPLSQIQEIPPNFQNSVPGTIEVASGAEPVEKSEPSQWHPSRWAKLALSLVAITLLTTVVIWQISNSDEKVDHNANVIRRKIPKINGYKAPDIISLQQKNGIPSKTSNVEKKRIASRNYSEKIKPNDDNKVKIDTQKRPAGVDATALAAKTFRRSQQDVMNAPVPPQLTESLSTLSETGLDTEGVETPCPYSILLSSYRSRKLAERAFKIYAEKDLSPYLVKVDLGESGIWYRIFSGYFENINQAENAVREYKLNEAAAKKTKYAMLIDTYSSEEMANVKIRSLVTLGYSPYVIKANNGRFLLYVGAFYTKKGAEDQCSELISNDIQCQAVERKK